MSGTLFIITAPGAGKTTLVRSLLRRDHLVRLSISYTTREPRPGERDGNDYHFRTCRPSGAAATRANFSNGPRCMATTTPPRKSGSEEIDKGHDILLEIDWQGAQQVRRSSPRRSAYSSCRLRWRSSKQAGRPWNRQRRSTIARRMAWRAQRDAPCREFDYVIINNELHRRARRPGVCRACFAPALSKSKGRGIRDISDYLEQD